MPVIYLYTFNLTLKTLLFLDLLIWGIRWPGWPQFAHVIPHIPPWMSCGEQSIWWQHRICGYCCQTNCSAVSVCNVFCAQAYNRTSICWFICETLHKKKILHSFASPKCSIKYCLIFTVLLLLRRNLASFRMESSADDYRIQSFDMDTQMLLKTALKG